jgi:hypothetical protein
VARRLGLVPPVQADPTLAAYLSEAQRWLDEQA